MFNIWKQAWRNEDTITGSEASVNLETQSGATGDQFCPSLCLCHPSDCVFLSSTSQSVLFFLRFQETC